jgi:FkbM family methyltransferase
VLGIRVEARPEDVIGRHLFKYGTWESDAVDYIRRHVSFAPGDIAFDVGANLGWFSLVLDRVAPEGVDVFSFEPDPVNHALLSDNVRLNDARKVHIFQQAISDSEETRLLHLYPGKNRGRHSLLPLHEGPVIDVAATTLDGFCRRAGLEDRVCRFIKIDIEGYEYFAVKGAQELMSRARTVIMEFSPAYMAKSGIEPRDLLDLMLRAGLHPNRLGPDGPVACSRDDLLASSKRVDIVWLRQQATA